jgi:hypothetical protein
MIVVQEHLPRSIIRHRQTRCHGHNMHDPATTRHHNDPICMPQQMIAQEPLAAPSQGPGPMTPRERVRPPAETSSADSAWAPLCGFTHMAALRSSTHAGGAFRCGDAVLTGRPDAAAGTG